MEKRKSYTLSKEREVWTPEEHAKFLECLARYGRDWKRAEAVICTKNVLQIRSHAQKHFMKLRRPDAAAAAATATLADGWAAHAVPADAASATPAAGKALLHAPRRAGRYSYADAAAAAAAGADAAPQGSGDGSAGDMRSLSPALLTAARFEAWLGENNLLPPNEGFAQFAEAQQRLHEQLRAAQEFLQHVMGYSSGGAGSASSSAGSSGSSRSSVAGAPVDYLRVYTFLCVALEGGARGAALHERLQQLRPLEQEVAVLLLHQLVVTRVARRLRTQFDSHAARVLADIEKASSSAPPAAERASSSGGEAAVPAAQPFSSYSAAQGDGM